MNTFYGYGNYEGRYWFIGMEEGGGKRVEENAARIDAWAQRGSHELEDLVGKHSDASIIRYFRDKPAIQRTWGGLIRLLLTAQGHAATTTQAIRLYQRDSLGRANGNDCLLELLPLPSPSTKHWIYGEGSALPQLRTRQTYMDHYAEPRALHIKERLAKHKPSNVVFYSVNDWYQQWWRLISGVELKEVQTDSGRFYVGRDRQTTFAMIKHPATMGLRNEYFYEVGRVLNY